MSGMYLTGEVPFRERPDPRPGPRRAGPQDVEVARQRDRPARHDRRVRGRRAAIRSGAHGRPRAAEPPAVEGGHRGRPELREQDLERRRGRCSARTGPGDGAPGAAGPRGVDARPSAGCCPGTRPASRRSTRRWTATASTRPRRRCTGSPGPSSATGASRPRSPAGRPVRREERHDASRVVAWVLERTLRLLHPFMPFVTEEIWQRFGVRGFDRDRRVARHQTPTTTTPTRRRRFGFVRDLVANVRQIRGIVGTGEYRLVLSRRDDRGARAAARGRRTPGRPRHSSRWATPSPRDGSSGCRCGGVRRGCRSRTGSTPHRRSRCAASVSTRPTTKLAGAANASSRTTASSNGRRPRRSTKEQAKREDLTREAGVLRDQIELLESLAS